LTTVDANKLRSVKGIGEKVVHQIRIGASRRRWEPGILDVDLQLEFKQKLPDRSKPGGAG
jgi:hypothetical protein